MQAALAALVRKLDDPVIFSTNVIRWSSPVPSFGNALNSQVATLGLNPSNLEFVDHHGRELDGSHRRFHTLRSLGLHRWSDAKNKHLDLIEESCAQYFERNPYDTWFKKLNTIIEGTRASFYGDESRACHLDLIPFATARKWGELPLNERRSLLALSGDSLGLLLRDSDIRVLVLNGRGVVGQLMEIANINVKTTAMPSWTLPRKAGPGVAGIAVSGTLNQIANVKLKRPIAILGFNHNIQSSFGVTSEVKSSIGRWVTKQAAKALQ